jgi:hypothetical protein
MSELISAGEYAAFLRGGEYFNATHWSPLAPPRSGGDELLRRIGWSWALRHQPALGLSWYEAEAYARWRGGRLPLTYEAREARTALGIQVQVAEWCFECYYPGAFGRYVRPEPPLRRRVEGWSASECLVPAMSNRSIGFRVVTGDFSA